MNIKESEITIHFIMMYIMYRGPGPKIPSATMGFKYIRTHGDGFHDDPPRMMDLHQLHGYDHAQVIGDKVIQGVCVYTSKTIRFDELVMELVIPVPNTEMQCAVRHVEYKITHQ